MDFLEVGWGHGLDHLLLWARDRPIAETSDNTQHSKVTDIHAAGGIRIGNTSKRSALNRSATGIGL
jgi:hypothetical protein